MLKKILAAAGLLCLLAAASKLAAYREEDITLEAVSEITASYTAQVPTASSSGRHYGTEGLVDVAGLKAENPDTVGVLEIPGAGLFLPVVRNARDGYYLHRDFFGEISLYGSLYLDGACYEGGYDTLIYGHNMRNGRMFGSLGKYLSEDGYPAEHPYILFHTEGGTEVYEVAAAFTAEADDGRLLGCLVPYSEEESEALAEYVNSNNRLEGGVHPGDRLITLCTCEYSRKDGRLFVTGRLVDTVYRDAGTHAGTAD